MNRLRGIIAVAALAVGTVLATAPATASIPASTDSTPTVEPSCARPSAPDRVRCLALRRTDVKRTRGVMPDATTPSGFGPADLIDAYSLPGGSAGDGATVAIVDAYDDPTAESDLAIYRQQYGLPPCTTANGCFRKVDQRGGTDYPAANGDWSGEISLDVDMVSAVCPNCHILLVEGDAPNLDSLSAAVDQAVAMGARYVSNSYGSDGEGVDDPAYNAHYDHPGVVITASTGDTGYGVEYPAASPGVVAVGGTSLLRDTSTARGWAEQAWSGAGSGCSAYQDKPAWQTDTGCDKRSDADVSAVADPKTGVAVYYGGWSVYGGTSASAPIIAATYALAGTPAAGTEAASYPYDAVAVDPNAVNDVTSGSNGTCGAAYLCNGTAGYDGPTGLGTPNGVGAFRYQSPGEVTGTITDSDTGKPLSNADVTAIGRHTRTGTDGRYHLGLPDGSWEVTASIHGYQAKTVTVTVAGGQASTQDIALDPIPTVAVTGTVTDGSGHGWGLYATVTASDGTTTHTDPATGRYELDLLQNQKYTLHVAAIDAGYTATDVAVPVGTDAVSKDVALTVESTCTAAGYRATEDGTVQSFDRTRAPKGWVVQERNHNEPGYADGPGWQFTNPGDRDNATGGSGNFAVVDSDHSGQHAIQDTTLTSPTFDLSAAATPALSFGTELRGAVNSTATVETSTDGGATWKSVWRKAGTTNARGPVVVELPAAAGHQVQVRFHYVGSWSRWWEIDDVFVGDRTCDPVAGGLLVGRVTDTAGAGLTGTVAAAGATVDTDADGRYRLFAPAGDQSVTATAPNHTPATRTATVTLDHTTALDFTLS
ncbi:carboxypeptidase regulatory-like domain-containing protein [Actinocatenispora sera]|uniref:carboxypeptidase regulatory-like domain-containing protein n=1 Tax=Actinocatenispora sera TaxID=390989 RepID=UPI0033DB309E